MDFGIFIRPGHYSWDHTCALIQAAETAGFHYVWFGDSHLIWQEVSPYLTLSALQSETLRFGPLVTNPVTRHPTVMASTMATLNELSNGRAILGLGPRGQRGSHPRAKPDASGGVSDGESADQSTLPRRCD